MKFKELFNEVSINQMNCLQKEYELKEMQRTLRGDKKRLLDYIINDFHNEGDFKELIYDFAVRKRMGKELIYDFAVRKRMGLDIDLYNDIYLLEEYTKMYIHEVFCIEMFGIHCSILEEEKKDEL